jgi:hypothetical protein
LALRSPEPSERSETWPFAQRPVVLNYNLYARPMLPGCYRYCARPRSGSPMGPLIRKGKAGGPSGVGRTAWLPRWVNKVFFTQVCSLLSIDSELSSQADGQPEPRPAGRCGLAIAQVLFSSVLLRVYDSAPSPRYPASIR